MSDGAERLRNPFRRLSLEQKLMGYVAIEVQGDGYTIHRSLLREEMNQIVHAVNEWVNETLDEESPRTGRAA